MDEKSLFTNFWTTESKTTQKVLSRIPEKSDYRPDPKSRTAQEIAWQIVCEEKMIIDALENGKAEWAPPPMPCNDERRCHRVRETKREHCPTVEHTARRPLEWKAGILRWRTGGVTNGVELSL